MGLIVVKPFDAETGKTGISFSQGESRGRAYFRLNMTADSQVKMFGRRLDPATDAIFLTVTNEANLNHLMGIKVVSLEATGALPIIGAVHGSIGLKVASWRPNKGKMPSMALAIVNEQVAGGGFSVRLPEWARAIPDPRSASPAPRS